MDLMHPTFWLVGCALCTVSIGVAAATMGGTQDMDSSAHAVVDSGTQHEGSSASGGDVLGAIRDSDQRGSGAHGPANPSSSGDRAGSVPASPARPHQPHVGWQSLLPGSIQ